MSKPLVSVLMPIYNGERYLAEAVESILAQTFRDFEFIILDDGSKDGSLKILESYAAKDERIRLLSRPNKGIGPTRNEMARRAQGEFIAVMDSDDIAMPERLARQVEFLEQNPEVVCVGSSHQVIDQKGRLLTYLILPESNEEIQRQALAGHGSICHPCAMIRHSALIEIGGYDETLIAAHDLDLWLKLGEVGELVNLKEMLLKYRLHMSSISEQNRVLQRQEAREACERAWRRRGIEGHFEASKPWRPGSDRQSQHHFMLQYGWWAWSSGQRQTAAIYALRSIKALPLAADGWKLLACTAIKPLPTAQNLK